MRILYTHKAAKQLEKLPRLVQKRIAAKMRFYAKQRNPSSFAETLTNFEEGQFRFRIGDYRVIFDTKGDSIFVLKIGKRDKIYE